jgi:hypothetical protein
VVGLAAEGLRLPRTRPLGPEEAPSERTEEPEVAQAEVSDMLADGGSRRLGLAEAGPPRGSWGLARRREKGLTEMTEMVTWGPHVNVLGLSPLP